MNSNLIVNGIQIKEPELLTSKIDFLNATAFNNLTE
jgi:hypothetical protein